MTIVYFLPDDGQSQRAGGRVPEEAGQDLRRQQQDRSLESSTRVCQGQA